jgi:tRNA pseudouridine13 synthase
MVKLRQTAEDFLVTELGGPEPIVGSAFADCEHRLYCLEKKDHDTISLLARLSRKFHLARRSFGISGFKDRHAITSQKVSLPVGKGQDLPMEIGQSVGDLSTDLSGEGWRLTLLGGSDKKLRSGSHSANHFIINVRDVTQQQLEGIPRRLEQAKIHGWPNWFDTQRFGSAVGHRLPGTHIIAGEYEAAMRLHLTERNKSDRSDKRRDKKKFAAAWPKISDIRPEHRPFSKPLKALARAREAGVEGEELWRRVYMALPYDIRGMWLSAWQSREWNNLLAELLFEQFGSHLLYSVNIGVGGPLLFPEAPSGKRGAPKRHLIADIQENLQELPETMEMPHSELDLTAIDQYLSNHPRPLFIHSKLDVSEGQRDEMSRSKKGKRWMVSLEFELPPGAYATVLIKRLFH